MSRAKDLAPTYPKGIAVSAVQLEVDLIELSPPSTWTESQLPVKTAPSRDAAPSLATQHCTALRLQPVRNRRVPEALFGAFRSPLPLWHQKMFKWAEMGILEDRCKRQVPEH